MSKALEVGDTVALVDPVSYGVDGYDIGLKDGDTAVIEERQPDDWFSVRLHKAPNIIVEFHASHLRDICEPVGDPPRRRRSYRILVYPLAIAATMTLFVSRPITATISSGLAHASHYIPQTSCAAEDNALYQVSVEMKEINDIVAAHKYSQRGYLTTPKPIREVPAP